jgi:hypothetical protein
MKETISEAERSMRELDYLFMAEQHRISDLFGERHKQFFVPRGRNLKQNLMRSYRPYPSALARTIGAE